MSKIGKMGTIFAIYSGFAFTILGLAFLLGGFSAGFSGLTNGFLLLLGIPLLIYGLILIFGGFKQLKDIKKGKEYKGPPDGFKIL